MSEIRVNSVKGVSASTAALTINNTDGTCTANLTNNRSSKNKIINGSFMISQRGTSESGINGANEGYRQAPDRWKVEGATFGAHTVSQSTDSPNEFGFSYRVNCTTAETSLSASSFFEIIQKIEGFNLQDFAKGTSDAKQFALSFHVKTTKTGTYVVFLLDHDSSRMCCKTYTVSDTNWNKYEIIFPADTTGAFDNDKNASLSVKFVLVAGTTFTSGTLQSSSWGSVSNANSRVGQVNFADSTSNNWYLSGVQLEVGGVVTDYEHKSITDEYLGCARYFQQFGGTRVYFAGRTANQDGLNVSPACPVPMRNTPSVSGGGSYDLFSSSGSGNSSTTPTIETYQTRDFNQCFLGNVFFTLASGTYCNDARVGSVRIGDTLNFDAEL